ncbi:hypothetical protein [Faecalibaculum rodentium]|uniref:hypothetical protein n=1 Tax=Faecalibaculum rodentium TaxID=1702221 RepID=UPI00260B4C25|nr:hypothetical protein [Faecalibaculum rodentium]
MKLKCQFPEHVPGSLRLRFLRGGRFIWLYPIVVAGILVAASLVSLLDRVQWIWTIAIIGVLILAALISLTTVLDAGLGHEVYYPNASKTEEVFCSLSEAGIVFESDDPGVIYIPKVDWSEIQLYQIDSYDLYLSPAGGGSVLIVLDLRGISLQEMRSLTDLLKTCSLVKV